MSDRAERSLAGAPAFIAPSARLQTESDGHVFGGRIAIESGVTISDGAILATYGGTIEIQANAYVGPYCVLYGHGGLVIGRNAGSVVTKSLEPFSVAVGVPAIVVRSRAGAASPGPRP